MGVARGPQSEALILTRPGLRADFESLGLNALVALVDIEVAASEGAAGSAQAAIELAFDSTDEAVYGGLQLQLREGSTAGVEADFEQLVIRVLRADVVLFEIAETTFAAVEALFSGRFLELGEDFDNGAFDSGSVDPLRIELALTGVAPSWSFSGTLAIGAIAVPEPGSGTLLLVGAVLLWRSGRHG